MSSAPHVAIDLPRTQIEAFCRRWKIIRLDLFGSVLREDFRDSSDVDALVVFSEDDGWSLMDLVRAEEEIGRIIGRRVELVERASVEMSQNWIRREEILSSAVPFYAA